MGLISDSRDGPGLRDAGGRPLAPASQRTDPFFAGVSNELADRGLGLGVGDVRLYSHSRAPFFHS